MSIRSDEQNIIAAKNREIAALKAEVKSIGDRKVSDLMVTYGADMLIAIERQAKIEVLEQWARNLRCNHLVDPLDIASAMDREINKLKQLDATK